MNDERGIVAERFDALPRLEDDSDWDEVVQLAGLRLRSRSGRRSVLIVGLVVLVGLGGATLLGTRLHRAVASPPGPTHVQRQVPNGTVHWLFAHQPRGESLPRAHIALLSTTGAHWQPVRFARAITPDPSSHLTVVLTLIGKHGRNICMTVYSGHSATSGGCAIGLLLRPFSYQVSSHLNPNCASCSDAVIAGVASDEVARMELFLPGRQQRVPLKDNVFTVSLGATASTWNLVAYDRRGLIIGKSSPPTMIPIAAPVQTPANPPAGLTVTRVISTPGGHGPLSPTHENVIPVHAGFDFAITLENGDIRRNLAVSVTISPGAANAPFARRHSIIMKPRSAATVRLGNLAGKILFAQREVLKVTVTDAQRRETWIRSYPIIFSLG